MQGPVRSGLSHFELRTWNFSPCISPIAPRKARLQAGVTSHLFALHLALRTSHFALLFLLLSLPLLAQSPRLSLIEEVSNASCVPCVQENPIFEKFVADPAREGSVITIVYHGNWPGRDTMNIVSPEMSAARVLYYGVTGVPRVMVNGVAPKGSTPFWRVGAPADTVAIDSALDLVAGSISPLTIGIDQILRNDSIFVAVDVHSSEAIVGKRLRVVLVEGERHYPSPQAGSNGEEDFLYIARAMLPSPDGIIIDIPAGETRSFAAGIPVDPAWQGRGMYVVAFVQDDATREVLQSAANKGRVEMTSSDPAGIRTDAAIPARWRIDAASADSNSYRIEIESDLPENWRLSLRLDGKSVAHGDIITLAPGDRPQFEAMMSSDERSPGRGSYRVTLRGERGAIARHEGRLYAGEIDLIALRRENETFPIARFYQPALRHSPLSYALVEPEDEDLFEIDSAPILMFALGNRALDSSDLVLLKSYLDGGGRLFLIGSEIAWGLAAPENREEEYPRDPLFLEQQLHAGYVAGSSFTTAVNGVPRDPVAAGVGFLFRSEAEMRTTPDRIVALPPARTVLGYGGSRTDAAAIRYADAATRVLFFAFGFEGIGDTTLAALLMEKGIVWLAGSDLTVAAPLDIASDAAVGEPAPNPARGSTSIAVTLSGSSVVRLEVRDMIGRNVIEAYEQKLPAGIHRLPVFGEALPAGVYLVTVEVDGERSVRKLVVSPAR